MTEQPSEVPTLVQTFYIGSKSDPGTSRVVQMFSNATLTCDCPWGSHMEKPFDSSDTALKPCWHIKEAMKRYLAQP